MFVDFSCIKQVKQILIFVVTTEASFHPQNLFSPKVLPLLLIYSDQIQGTFCGFVCQWLWIY